MKNCQSTLMTILHFPLKKFYDDNINNTVSVKRGESFLIHLKALHRRPFHQAGIDVINRVEVYVDSCIRVSGYVGNVDSPYVVTQEQLIELQDETQLELPRIEGKVFLNTAFKTGVWLVASYKDGKFDLSPPSEGHWLNPDSLVQCKEITLNFG